MPTAARDRLVETAAALFYARGLPNVGINAVIDQAGVARMSLYNHFPSKDALAEAVYEREAGRRRERIDAALRRSTAPEQRLSAVFDVAEELSRETPFRGCAFIGLAAQIATPDSRLHAVARRHKAWLLDRFREIAADARHDAPDMAAQQFLALWDGAITEAYIQGSTTPLRAARSGALALLAFRGDGA